MASAAGQVAAGARTAAAKGVAWLRRLRTWQRRLDVWLGEADLFWLAIMVLALALAVAFGPPVVPWGRERLVRLTGMALQVAGLATVALGIRQTRKVFDRPSYVDMALRWLRRWPRWSHRIIGIVSDAQVQIDASGTGYFRAGRVARTVEGRVEELEAEVDHLHRRIDSLLGDTDAKHREQSAALQAERDARAAGDAKLDSRLEAAAAGGLHLSAMGLVWLFVGVVLASMSLEIAGWYR